MFKFIIYVHRLRKLFFLLIVFSSFCNISFAQSNKSNLNTLIAKYNLDSTMIYKWRNDSLGCVGRINYAFKIDTMQVLKGIKTEDFIILFGTADSHSKDEVYEYNVFSSCEDRNHIHDVSYLEIVFGFTEGKLTYVGTVIVD